MTGHCLLNKHMQAIGFSNTSPCRFCGIDEETSIHIIAICPAVSWKMMYIMNKAQLDIITNDEGTMVPMDYRFIPGHSIDYQPLIITPFLRRLPNPNPPSLHYLPVPKTTLKPEVKKQETTLAPTTKPNNDRNDKNSADSKIHHMKNPLDTYKFNGRPFKVSVAHARPKDKVNAANLSSKFYYSKNIIY